MRRRLAQQSRLAKKGTGKEAKLSCAAHARMENRHGLLVDFVVTEATGTAECAAPECSKQPTGHIIFALAPL